MIGYMKGSIPGVAEHREHEVPTPFPYGGASWEPDTPLCWCGVTYRRVRADFNARAMRGVAGEILLWNDQDSPDRHRAAWAKVLGIDAERLTATQTHRYAYRLELDGGPVDASIDQAMAVGAILQPQAFAHLVPPFYR